MLVFLQFWAFPADTGHLLDLTVFHAVLGLVLPRYSLSNSSLGAMFLMRVLIFVSSWIVALMLTVHITLPCRPWVDSLRVLH